MANIESGTALPQPAPPLTETRILQESVLLPTVAIQVIDVSYKHKRVPILHKVNMTILEGKIYGLLGPSGCGKTTLLRSIVGLLRPTSGKILVFGVEPATKACIVPGPDVGYMPQDIALYMDLTVQENLDYFARICGLSSTAIKERTAFLNQFLELPPPNRNVFYLSGGQKRRVSLAAALIQNPTVLILDEPTVGLDPVLRESIWKHLFELSEQKKLTTIITTHYIEEAQRAARIAFMRQGGLLAEEDPKILLELFKTISLEDVFLKFCQADAQTMTLYNERASTDYSNAPSGTRKKTTFSNQILKRTQALVKKGAIRIGRNIPNLVVQVVLPGIQMILFCICFGKKPHDLVVNVYDQDQNYSRHFIGYLNREYIIANEVDSFEKGYNAIVEGQAWGLLHFPEHYTRNIQNRLLHNMTEHDLDSITGVISILNRQQLVDYSVEANKSAKFYADFSHFPMKGVMLEQLGNASEYFLRDFLVREISRGVGKGVNRTTQFGLTATTMIPGVTHTAIHNVTHQNISQHVFESLSAPLLEVAAVYGSTTLDTGFRDFAVPGLIVSINYMLAASLTALAFVIERKEGVLERSMIVGVKAYQFILSHIILQFTIVIFQVVIVLICSFVLFETPLVGSPFLVGLITTLQGIAGMSFGLLVSSIFQDEVSALTAVVGSFLPTLILSAVFWPQEAMPEYMQWVSYALPHTLPCKAIRSVVLRGWGIAYFEVWFSIIVVLLWILAFNAMAIISFAYI